MGYLHRSQKYPHTAASADIAQCLLGSTALLRATVILRVTVLLRGTVILRAAVILTAVTLLRAKARRRDTGHRPSERRPFCQAKRPITALPIR